MNGAVSQVCVWSVEMVLVIVPRFHLCALVCEVGVFLHPSQCRAAVLGQEGYCIVIVVAKLRLQNNNSLGPL
jgi:hypothetical protein